MGRPVPKIIGDDRYENQDSFYLESIVYIFIVYF